MRLHERIEAIDYETVTPSELATVLEQVFLYHDSRARDGGPIITAQGILQKYADSVRRRAMPELHVKVKGRCAELRSAAAQLETLIGRLEKDNAQART